MAGNGKRRRQSALADYLRSRGFLDVLEEYPVRTGGKIAQRLDVALPLRKVAIECNGALHDRPAFGAQHQLRRKALDERKKAWLKANGWQLIEYLGDVRKATLQDFRMVFFLVREAQRDARIGNPAPYWPEGR